MLSEVSPRVGIVTVPPAPGVGGMNGCVCVSWCSSTHQVSALGGSAPSRASPALPA